MNRIRHAYRRFEYHVETADAYTLIDRLDKLSQVIFTVAGFTIAGIIAVAVGLAIANR